MRRRFLGAVALLLVGLAADRAAACDVCAVYTATELLATRTGIRLGVAEQFSRFDTRVPNAAGVPEDIGEHLNGSTTQVLLGWDPRALFGFQLNLPIIARTYRRLEDGVLVGDRIVDGVFQRGSETGIGDLSLIGLLRPWSYVDEESVFRFTLLGGLKFPTGDSSRLEEEVEARERAQAGQPSALGLGRYLGREGHHIPEGSPTGINGHDLALGSGSWDGILGFLGYASYDRFFLTANAIYSLRTEGSFDYQYGNEVNWFVSIGGYVLLDHDYTLALQLVQSGVQQDADTLDGTSTAGDDDDGDARLWAFLGPGLTFTYGTSLAAEIAGDLPVARNDIGLRPEYRVRGGITWRF